jgi:anti-sigma-K factor RskA
MTSSHFHSLLSAINEVRSELSERLDRIEERLRDVEEFQHRYEAANETRQDSSLSLRWRIGIAVSAIGTIVTVALRFLEVGR